MAKRGLGGHLFVVLSAMLWTGLASAGTWQPVGLGDCPVREVATSRGPVPEAGKCDASFAGLTAVCWTTGCSYKSVATTACTGGATPGQMYTCMATAPAATAAGAASGGWQAAGVGDCTGRDVGNTTGARPDPAKCNAGFAGNTAVCWPTGCTYKSVPTAACTGGQYPGQMYTCAVAAPPPPPPPPSGPVWQAVGLGDCPGRDVGATAGSRPDPAKCNAGFAGNTAVCWSTGCSYKTVLTGQCIGGSSPGQMYTCAAAPAAAPAPAAVPVPAPAPAPTGGAWQPIGVGDCQGHDVSGSRGPYPEPAQCSAAFAGMTAVCWSTGCTYKNLPTAKCSGGPSPGQMYTCTAAAAAAPPPAAAPPAPAKPKGRRYAVINFTGDKQSTHEFVVDWKACKVAETSPESDVGTLDITIDVCRPGSRLVIKSESRASGQWTRYDWVVLDNDATLAGSYRDAATCGPSVGKRAK
jgi:hypothetical protein